MPEINWVEIPVFDLQRAKSFYENVFSVDAQEYNLEDEKHIVFKTRNIGGFLHLAKDGIINNGISIYFHVSRMSEVLEKAEYYGGEILLSKTLLKSYTSENTNVISYTMFDGKIGYIAKIKDTEGNIIGVHSNS